MLKCKPEVTVEIVMHTRNVTNFVGYQFIEK
uniref:Uncharacterized protein n=1 Tax=Anguilla anguilla TaxID=7936 RepID=A0A0E9REB4_ANGAN